MTLNASEIASMRSTVTDTQLGMTCTIQRRTGATVDGYGHKAQTWASHLASLACWYWEFDDTETTGPDTVRTVKKARLIVPAGTDVQPDDRVQTVTGVDGSAVASNLNVREVIEQLGHTVLELEQVTA